MRFVGPFQADAHLLELVLVVPETEHEILVKHARDLLHCLIAGRKDGQQGGCTHAQEEQRAVVRDKFHRPLMTPPFGFALNVEPQLLLTGLTCRLTKCLAHSPANLAASAKTTNNHSL